MKPTIITLSFCLLLYACGSNSSGSKKKADEPKTNKDLIEGDWQSATENGKAVFSFHSGFAELQSFVGDKPDTTFKGAYSFRNNLSELIMDFSGVMHNEDDIITLNDSVMVLQSHTDKEITNFIRVK
jgi:hypothetical protein